MKLFHIMLALLISCTAMDQAYGVRGRFRIKPTKNIFKKIDFKKLFQKKLPSILAEMAIFTGLSFAIDAIMDDGQEVTLKLSDQSALKGLPEDEISRRFDSFIDEL